MPRPSSIDRLPKEIKALIGELREAGCTIDEIMQSLGELKVRVSRSSMGRHVQRLDRLAERLRNSRAVAEALVPKDGSDTKLLRLNVELLQTAVHDLLDQVDEETGQPVRLDPESAMMIGRALQSATSAAKTDQELRGRIRREAEEAAAKRAEKVAREQGLTRDTVEAIKASILGVAA